MKSLSPHRALAAAFLLAMSGGCRLVSDRVDTLGGGGNGNGNGRGTGTGTGNGSEFLVAAPDDSGLRLGTRSYVASTLKQIFGTAAASVVDDKVQKRIIHMGGEACDPYDTGATDPCDGPKDEGRPLTGQADSGQASMPMLPAMMTARLAWVDRACEQIASMDSAIQAAVAQIGGSTSQVASRDKILAAYDLFNPGRPPAANFVSALETIVAQAQGRGYAAIEGWRFVMLTLCLDPAWQML